MKFTRGVKLTVQHPYDRLQAAAPTLNSQGTRLQGQPLSRLSFNLDALWASQMETPGSVVSLPVVFPPRQQQFTSNQTGQTDQQILREIHLSFDQRQEGLGVMDRLSTTPGDLAQSDMDRYSMTIRLLERTPTVLGGATTVAQEVLRFTIPGTEAFGTVWYQTNPVVLSGLAVPLNPYKVYVLELAVPGLYTSDLTKEKLCQPSLSLSLVTESPWVERDKDTGGITPDIQNLPTIHRNQAQPDNLTLTIPAADSLIDATALTASFEAFDSRLRQGLGCGTSTTPGQASDLLPREQIGKDAFYSTIVVPLFHGYGDVRSRDMASVDLPYCPAPYTTAAIDRRMIPVPTGFTVHHVSAVQTLNSPVSTLPLHAAQGTEPSGAAIWHRVGVALCSGRDDNLAYTQVAYGAWQSPQAGQEIDRYQLSTALTPYWSLQHVPLQSVAPLNTSFYPTGQPFYLGKGDSTTSSRTQVANGGWTTPPTQGRESWLEVRWSIEDAVAGLNDPANPDDVRIGVGGHYVIISGIQQVF